MSSPRGMSLHIGINVLDRGSYPLEPPHPDYPDGWDGYLESCEFDAEALCEIAKAQGFETTMLLSQAATAENVIAEIRRAAKELQTGDMFFITYAGHGGQVPDRSRDETDDRLDETWCLYNRQFLDDEQYALYSEFAAGVRILILSDSCHSGTVSRGPLRPRRKSATARCMPPESVRPIYVAKRKFYDDIQKNTPKVQPDDVKASIRLLSACKDTQEADGDAFNGFFTRAVVDVWDGGKFKGTYEEFYERVKAELESTSKAAEAARSAGEPIDETALQTPNHYVQGIADPSFEQQTPFTI